MTRTPPNSIAAEQAVLGSMINDESMAQRLAAFLDPQDFYMSNHHCLFGMMSGMVAAGLPLDPVTLDNELRRQRKLSMVGGIEYLTELSGAAPSPKGGMGYARIVRHHATLRGLIKGAQELEEQCYSGVSVEDAISKAEGLLMEATDTAQRTSDEMQEPASLADDFLAGLDKKVTQVMTPIEWLNELTAGFVAGNLWTLAGRTSSGKSAMALQIAKHIADMRKVVYVSLEMPPSELLSRYVASETGLSQRHLMLHRIPQEMRGEMERSLKRYKGSKLYFTASGRTPEALDWIMRRHKPALLVVDTVNLVKAPGETERVRMLNATRDLKQSALKHDVPVLMLAQLSRRADEKAAPTLADLKESASIEEDSDVVLLLTEVRTAKAFEALEDLHRDIPGGIGAFQEVMSSQDRYVAGLIQKNRNGPLGAAAFRFKASRFTFEPLAADCGQRTHDENGDELPF
jgi:replicative DNA helicase